MPGIIQPPATYAQRGVLASLDDMTAPDGTHFVSRTGTAGWPFSALSIVDCGMVSMETTKYNAVDDLKCRQQVLEVMDYVTGVTRRATRLWWWNSISGWTAQRWDHTGVAWSNLTPDYSLWDLTLTACKYRVVENFVDVHMVLVRTTANTQTDIATIPANFAPGASGVTTRYFPALFFRAGAGNVEACGIQVLNTGEMYAKPRASGYSFVAGDAVLADFRFARG